MGRHCAGILQAAVVRCTCIALLIIIMAIATVPATIPDMPVYGAGMMQDESSHVYNAGIAAASDSWCTHDPISGTLHGQGGIQVAFGHSMFNSAEEFIAGYRVQVATAPEFPQIDEPSMFLVKVTDVEFEEVDRFTMGIRFFFNGQQIDAVPPTPVEGGHWDFAHVWRQQGNHIVKVDLYDMPDKPGVTTYTFNMGTQSPFGYIFIIAITVGAICFAVVMMYIYMPRLLGDKRRRDGGSSSDKSRSFGR